MPSFNKVILAGNLTRDPGLRQISTGTKVCSFGLAINRSYTTQAGEKRDEVCFVDIVAWGKTGEACAEYLKKGSAALVEGHLHLNEWEKDGKKHRRHEVVAERVTFLGGKGEGGGAAQGPAP